MKKLYEVIKSFLAKHPVLGILSGIGLIAISDTLASWVLRTAVEVIPLMLLTLVATLFIWKMLTYTGSPIVAEKREKAIRVATVSFMISLALFAIWIVIETVVIALRLFGVVI